MKNRLFNTVLILVFSFTFTSFVLDKQKKINIEKSEISWIGYKVLGHKQGTIKLKEGTLLFENKKLAGGNFIIDMTTINASNLKGNLKTKLETHLMSDDFFGVKNYPTSALVFTKVKKQEKNYAITAKLTIKGITNEIQFEMELENNTAHANLKIDRTKFKIKYGSSTFFDNLKDNAIKNEFDIQVDLVF